MADITNPAHAHPPMEAPKTTAVDASVPSAQMLRVDQSNNRWKTLFASKTFLFWALYSFISLIVLGFDLTIPGQVLSMPTSNKQFG
jgi:hypothetical protein